uniref:C-type lectin domain-containing protein n=1 Tax=Panagrolaimus sp. ES5 TaxID=591445 RepID=A0AC34FLC4_9BILA
MGTGGIPAQVGFDAGDSHNRTMLEVSCKDSVINISSMSNVGKPGVFVFRIDSAEIIKPPQLDVTTTTTQRPRLMTEGIKCPPNSIQLRLNESVCYSFHPSLSQFVVAERECNSFGANLVSFKNKYTGVYIPQLANLLFKHLEVEHFWTNAHRLIDGNTFTWTDGKDFEYKNWKNNESGEENNQIFLHFEKENINDCVAVNLEKGFWAPENCFSRLPFVCEFYGKGKQVPPTALALEEFPELSHHISDARTDMYITSGVY